MIQSIREFFAVRIASEERKEPSLELATAALLIEVSRADFQVSGEERGAIEEQVRKSFGLTEAETREIVAWAEEEVARAVSLYEFTRLVDEQLELGEKQRIVELLWLVAFADSRKDAHEEQIVRRVAGLLHVDHPDFIAAKLRARSRSEGAD